MTDDARPRPDRSALCAAYRAKKIAEGWVDLRRFVPRELRSEISDVIKRKIRRWRVDQDSKTENNSNEKA